MEMNAVVLVRTNSPCKKEVIGYISLIVSMFLSLSHRAFGIFATRKRVHHGLEIPLNFHFYGGKYLFKAPVFG